MQVDTWQERLITWTMIFVGNLTKKFGRKAMATDGPAVFIVGLVGAALASDSSALIICRIVQGSWKKFRSNISQINIELESFYPPKKPDPRWSSFTRLESSLTRDHQSLY